MNLTNLRLCRLLQGFKQTDLSVRSGISQPRISELERGLRPATEDERAALSAALDAPAEKIFETRDGTVLPSLKGTTALTV